MSTNAPAPLWLTVVRGIQLLFALITLALSAHALATVGPYSGFGLNIFTSIVTLFYIGYIVASTLAVQSIFNIWISLSFQAFLAIFWLATFGTLAALAVAFGVVESYDSYDSDYYYSYRNYGLTGELKIVSATTKTSTALSAFVWVLFVATLIYTALTAFRNRSGTTEAPAATQEHKMGPVAGGPTPTSYQPVEQYGQQPQYAAPYAAPDAQYPPQQQQFQQPAAYPEQTGTPAPYQQAGSPAPYQQPPVQYPQQTGSPSPAGYEQQTPYPPQQQQQQQNIHMLP